MARFGYIIAFFILLSAPPILRLANHGAEQSVIAPGAERLVVITPDDQDIRNEIAWAFSDWHLRKYGQAVELDYRNPGGSNDVLRVLDTIYRKIRQTHGGNLPPPDQIDTGIDVVFGGGDYVFDRQLKPLGVLQPLGLEAKIIADCFPQKTLGGVKLVDADWTGVCLDAYGIVYNADLCDALNIPPPLTWADLADPRFAGNISLADPTHSATAAIAYMIVLQRSMADAEEAFFDLPENHGIAPDVLRKTPKYQAALDHGWKAGMRRLFLIAANARYFTDSASRIPTDVSFGDAAAGVAIDFYGRVTEEIVGDRREKFVLPRAATAITPDTVAILYGTHGRQLELARHFVEFLLSSEGQRIWVLKPGVPGGPRYRALRRMPIRRSVYADRTNWMDDEDYFAESGGFNERPVWMAMMPDLSTIWAAAWIDDRDDLLAAYRKILAIPDLQRRANLLQQLSDPPMTRQELNQIMQDRQNMMNDPNQDVDLWRARLRLEWAARFREHYRKIESQAAGG
jgi:ABC-type Fe3+ transport system substrate-binding protein